MVLRPGIRSPQVEGAGQRLRRVGDETEGGHRRDIGTADMGARAATPRAASAAASMGAPEPVSTTGPAPSCSAAASTARCAGARPSPGPSACT
ncbi:hypothetical protein SR39_03505 [Methylobacterium radiotolerans]|nr:hypothetical protein SR39_03505 [Methylobacterium radiotolerans]